MGATLTDRSAATERKTLADVCGKPIKADRHPQVPATPLRALASEARERVMKLSTAADACEVTESRMSHKFSDGKLTLEEQEALGPEYLVELGRQLLEAYGPLVTPQARMRNAIREIRRRCDEAEQFLEFIA